MAPLVDLVLYHAATPVTGAACSARSSKPIPTSAASEPGGTRRDQFGQISLSSDLIRIRFRLEEVFMLLVTAPKGEKA